MNRENQFQSLVKFVYKYTQENGFPPSVREIGDAMGISSSSTIHKVIRQSIDEGYIEVHPKIARTIRISSEGKKLINID